MNKSDSENKKIRRKLVTKYYSSLSKNCFITAMIAILLVGVELEAVNNIYPLLELYREKGLENLLGDEQMKKIVAFAFITSWILLSFIPLVRFEKAHLRFLRLKI